MKAFLDVLFWLFYVGVVTVSIACFIGFFGSAYLKMFAARNWQPVAATILTADMEYNRGNGRVAVEYQYEFGNQVFRGDRYTFLRGYNSERRSLPPQLVPGNVVTAFIDPKQPSDSVIIRDWTWDAWFGLIPLFFAGLFSLPLIGGAFHLAGRFRARRKPRRQKTTATGGSELQD